VRILTAKDLFINQAALTGESLPVEKIPTLPDSTVSDALEMPNIGFLGSNVESGTAICGSDLDRQRNLFWVIGQQHQRSAPIDQFRQGRKQIYLVDDQLYVGDGTGGLCDQWISKGNWLGSLSVCTGSCSRADARDAADDRDG